MFFWFVLVLDYEGLLWFHWVCFECSFRLFLLLCWMFVLQVAFGLSCLFVCGGLVCCYSGGCVASWVGWIWMSRLSYVLVFL